MNSLLEKYILLSIKYKILIWLSIFIISLLVLPAILVFIAGGLISYFLIKGKFRKYSAITLFSFATLLSIILLIPTDSSQNHITEETGKNSLPNSSLVVKQNNNIQASTSIPLVPTSKKTYSVVRVVDGDTIDVSIDGNIERLRLIGINTPETVDPRKPVECFGVEASNKAKAVLTGKKIVLESDPSQGELDKYNRLLRYVFLEDGTNFNLFMIKEGYAYEYTYDVPYKYQSEFKQAQKEAESNKAGLWGAMCSNPDTGVITPVIPTQNTSSTSCTIKGNISSAKEKIYHVIGCASYTKTVIDESKGEKWFCTEQEALDAGWRKALNCN